MELSPEQETRRIAAVRRHDIPDTPPAGAFDRTAASPTRRALERDSAMVRWTGISPGVLDLYSSSSVELDADEVADAMAFADTAALLLLDARITETGVPSDTGASDTDRTDAAPFDDLGGYRAEIDQATGILMVQLGVGFEEAFVRLRAHAYARGTRISVVAADVVAHRLRLPPGTTPSDMQPPDARPLDDEP